MADRDISLLTDGIIKHASGVPSTAVPWTDYAPGLPTAAAGGTVDAITATYSPAVTLTTGTRVILYAAGANTGAVTFAPNSLTQKSVKKYVSTALVAGDIPGAGYPCDLEYDGTNWILLNPSADHFVIRTATATAKDVVYITAAGTAAAARANAVATLYAIGFATETKTAAACIIQTADLITITGATFTPGLPVYVSKDTAGLLVQDITGYTYTQMVGVAETATDVRIIIGPVVTVASSTIVANYLINDVYHGYGNSGTGAVTLDFSTYAMVGLTINGTAALTLTAPAFPSSVQILLTNGGAAAFTWVTTVKWPGGAAPTFTTTGLDIITLVWNGTLWYATAVIALA